MAASGPGQNATVEEILASIRQAISDDDARRVPIPTRPEPRPLPDRRVMGIPPTDDNESAASEQAESEQADSPPEPAIDQGVIEMAIERALTGVRAELDGRKPPVRPRPRPEVARVAPQVIPRATRASAPPLRREVGPARRALLSPQSDAQVSASFDDLAKAMIEGNANKLDRVIEDLLRPMLKGWLDDNLPQMVERMVREEIERVSRTGRR
jgi:cell pole-organizing protein PopZ